MARAGSSGRADEPTPGSRPAGDGTTVARTGAGLAAASGTSQTTAAVPPAKGASQLVEHFFRHETGRLHGALIRLVGVHNLTLAEDVAQEAMLRALRTWSMGGVPANPSAWITQVAMNLARDALRHQRMAGGKETAIVTHLARPSRFEGL